VQHVGETRAEELGFCGENLAVREFGDDSVVFVSCIRRFSEEKSLTTDFTDLHRLRKWVTDHVDQLHAYSGGDLRELASA
jgi:hypothetical protein